MYGNNPYMNSLYNPQANIDRINNQIAELEKMKQQIPQQIQPQQPANINQTFQLAPNNRDVMRYANSIDEVQREMVIGDTPFFSKDMSVVWVKNTKGDIKAYELNEIVEHDEKDMQIELLMSQINELKGMIQNERVNANVITEQSTTDTATNDETVGGTVKTSKSTGVSRVQASKKK